MIFAQQLCKNFQIFKFLCSALNKKDKSVIELNKNYVYTKVEKITKGPF